MKFSYKKKAKMREARLKQIRKNCSIICSLTSWKDWDSLKTYVCVDKATIKGEMFMLVKEPDGFGIYKLVSQIISESVKLSPKKLLNYKKAFEKPKVWHEKSSVKISDTGQLMDVEVAKFKENPFRGKGQISIYLPLY